VADRGNAYTYGPEAKLAGLLAFAQAERERWDREWRHAESSIAIQLCLGHVEQCDAFIAKLRERENDAS
jgi:hypothetical protein